MKKGKRFLSLVLALVMLIVSSSISLFAYALDDFSTGYDLQIYYYDDEGNFVEVKDQLKVMEQYDIQLYACLVYKDGTVWDITSSGMPADLYDCTLDWTSDARYLAFCEKNDGKIHGYDATKGEAIRNWLDSDIATIPVVGEGLKKLLLGLLDNDVTDIDNLDTEDVLKILDKALTTIKVEDDKKEEIKASLREKLDKFDVGISATLKDANGKVLDSDTVRVLVTKSDKLLSDVVPNAAFIKNYDSIPTTVAVGYEMHLDGIITPVRTHYDCEWTVTGAAGVLGSDLAEVDKDGNFIAKQEGTVQVKVSPDIKGLTKKLTDAFNALAKAGDLVDSETIAKAILLILGIPSDSDNYSTLVTIIKTIADSGVVDGDGFLRFSEDIMSPLANFILYVIYQDAITIKIVSPDAIPITSYELDGNFDKLPEGETTTLKFANVEPAGAVAHDYNISIENEEYAVFTDPLTILGIDGSTWDANYAFPNKTKVKCEMEGVNREYDLKVYANGNKNVVYIKINCDEYLDLNTPTAVNAVTYPKRASASLSYGWVMSDGTYNFATPDVPAYTEDGLAYVTSDGILYSTGCTVDDLVVQEKNGAIQTKQIMSGVQTTGVQFTKKHFWKKSESGVISTGIRGSRCQVSAYLTPADASFNNLTFTSLDTESVILSPDILTTSDYYSAVLTEERRAAHATATVEADENGYAVVYAYAVGNSSCYADVVVASQTGGFTDTATVAYANISVLSVDVFAVEDDDYLIGDGMYQITAGDKMNFMAKVNMSEAGSWKNQGFEDVEWKVSDNELATISSAGVFIGRDVGTVTVTATSVFGEIDGSVQVKILPDYRALKAAIAEADYDNLDPYDWSVESWERFDAYYQEAITKLADNSFVSQREVDALAENLSNSFHSLVRYMPIEGISLYCADDADGNGFATIDVGALENYTKKSTTIIPTVYPEGAEDYRITYTLSEDSNIRVNDEGIVAPTSDNDAAWGKITVTVTDPKNGNEFSQVMYVAFAKYQVTSVSVKPDNIHFVGVGADAETTSATISAEYNTSSSVTRASIRYGFFVSTDESVATVDAKTGLVLPVGIGKCQIICYSYDGGYTGVTNVSVTTNKSKLASAISRADSLIEEFYTEDSYAAVMSALSVAKDINADEDATQQAINDAAAALTDALNNLVRNPYANVYLSASDGGSVVYAGESYRGNNNKVRVLIEHGLNVTAVADSGYHFVRWVDSNGNTISTNATETFVIDYSAFFKAEFEEIHSPTSVKVYVDGKDVEYFTKDVSALANYTKQSVKLSYAIEPANANFYSVRYRTTSNTVTIDSDGTATPADNNTCYAVIDVVVTNTITGEEITDTVTVAFVKYALASVSASPSELVFNGTNSAPQQINITYSASSNAQTPSLRRGFFETSDSSVAVVDANGVVTPIGIGSCTINFTAYDGGKTTSATIYVYADKSALQSAIHNASGVIERNYTADSYAAMSIALVAANSVNNKTYATQQEVDDATSTLINAYNNLEKMDMVDYELFIEGNGTVSFGSVDYKQSSSINVKNASDITLVAAPDADNEFLGWYDKDGNLASSENTYHDIADGSCSVTARFRQLVYVNSVELTYNGNAVDFVPIQVPTSKTYTSQSVTLAVRLNPADPTHYTVNYSLGSDASNLKIAGATVSPASNNAAYGTVYVTVLDQSNGKRYTDSLIVSFANYQVNGVALNTNSLVFYGESSAKQTVDITYSSASIIRASIQNGFVAVEDDSVVDAYVDSGNKINVFPKRIGSTRIVFTTYDGGYKATLDVKVLADKSALNTVLSQLKNLNSEDYTEESFATVPQVIEYAQGVFDDEFVSQADVDSAAFTVQSLLSSLVLRDVITIKVSAIGNGAVAINGEKVSSIKAERGDLVKITAIPEEGYMVDAWYDDDGNIVSHNQNLDYVASSAVTLIAKFKAIPYIQRVVATYNGNETDFASVDVGTLSLYTRQTINLGCKVYPADADYEVVGYSLGTPNSNMSLSGNQLKPASNNAAYAQVIVTVRDNYSGKQYTDVIYASFAKNPVTTVSVSPQSLTFASANAGAQVIVPAFAGSKTDIKEGFFVSDDESVATVDSAGRVTPKGKGECVITFYAYNTGAAAVTSVTVGGNASVYGKVVAMDSPSTDTGSTPIVDATVKFNGKSYKTDANGDFVIYDVAPGTYNATVEYEFGMTRSVQFVVGSKNIRCTIPIVAVDYFPDGYINANDYVMMKRYGINNKAMFNAFYSATGYGDTFYPNMTL